MRQSRRGLVAAVLLAAACGEDPIGPPAPGRLVVSTVTEGRDPDMDGYQLAVDGELSATLPATGVDTVVLESGRHSVVLAGVAEQCTVDPGPSHEPEILPGRTDTLSFRISCPLTGLWVSVSTSGAFLDPDGYRLTVDGADRGVIGTSATVLLKRLALGAHTVSLSGLEVNCTPAETSRSVTVVADKPADVLFKVACVEPVGTIRVSAPTTGPAPGPYRVLLWYYNGWYYYDEVSVDLGALPPNGVLTAQAAAGVLYWVELSGVDPDCSVGVPNPTPSFTLTHGSAVELVFPVSCSAEVSRPGD